MLDDRGEQNIIHHNSNNNNNNNNSEEPTKGDFQRVKYCEENIDEMSDRGGNNNST